MSVEEIIRTIEADLSRLREARALLSESAEAPRRRSTSYSDRGKVTKSSFAGKNSEVRVSRRIFRSSGGAVGAGDSQRNSRVVSVPQMVVGKLPASSGLAAKRSQRTSEYRSASATRHPSNEREKPIAAEEVKKAAFALGGQVPSGVVVASPADAQRARDRSVKSELRPRPLTASPQSGKAAFDALFGN